MAQKIYIGNISKGLERFVLPFNIDNDAFPTLFNAYAWRGRVKKKRKCLFGKAPKTDANTNILPD